MAVCLATDSVWGTTVGAAAGTHHISGAPKRHDGTRRWARRPHRRMLDRSCNKGGERFRETLVLWPEKCAGVEAAQERDLAGRLESQPTVWRGSSNSLLACSLRCPALCTIGVELRRYKGVTPLPEWIEAHNPWLRRAGTPGH